MIKNIREFYLKYENLLPSPLKSFALWIPLAILAIFILFCVNFISRCHDNAIIKTENKAFVIEAEKANMRDSIAAFHVTAVKVRDSLTRPIVAALPRLKKGANVAHNTIKIIAASLPAPKADSLRKADAAVIRYEDTLKAVVDTLEKDTSDLRSALFLKSKNADEWRKADSTNLEKLIPAQQLAHKRLWAEILLGLVCSALATFIIIRH